MILGITGKSGTGKHTAADFFKQKGWKIIDVDKVAHKLYRPYQKIWRDVVDHFGEGILGAKDIIDRQKLKKIVFTPGPDGEKALSELNNIIHPEVKRYLKDELYYLKKRKQKVAVVAALWEEMAFFDVCDKVLLVTAGGDLTFDRIHKRDGIDMDMFQAYTKLQKDPDKADFTVVNEGDFPAYYADLNQILSKLVL